MNFRSITIFLIGILFAVHVHAQGGGGSVSDRIVVSIVNQPLSDAIRAIEANSKYTFFYDTNKTDLSQKVSLNARNIPVAQALGQMLSATDLDFEITNNQIALFPRRQAVRVAGTVMDARSVPLPGVTVVVDGTNSGTVTDGKGNFIVPVPSFPVQLNFSFLGYEPQTVSVSAASTNLKVYMAEDVIKVDDVVVVGYGSQKRVNLTGAISTVESAQLQDRHSYSVTHMLQGTVPGLNVTTSSGMPGNTASINIRGVNSINGGNPLILIDGVEGDLNKINSSDIETISVLKDASSAAVYGARATYGVILVTTKSVAASAGDASDIKTTISYSGRWGFGKPTVSTDYETRGYYSVWINDTFMKSYSGTGYTTYTEADYDELWARRNDKTEHPDRPWVMIDQRSGKDTYVYYGNTDWYHYLYRDTRPTMSQDLSLSGGNKKVQYYLSGNFFKEEGIMRADPDKFQKINFRSKINFEANKWMSFNNNTSYYNKKYYYPGPNGIANNFNLDKVHALASFVPVNPDGTSVYTTPFMSYTIMDGLPVVLNKGLHSNTDYNDYMSTTTGINIRPLKGLTIIGDFTYSFNTTRYSNRQVNGEYATSPGETATITTGRFEDKLAEAVILNNYYAVNAYATYETSIARDHNIKAMVGYNWETKMNKDARFSAYNLFSEVLNDMDLRGMDAEGNIRMENSGGFSEYVVRGYYARLNYDYKGRYLFEVSGRYDGTSRFPSDRRWGFFPSGSIGWRVSEEPFFEPVRKTVDNLKLRVSYGTLGNQQVDNYGYIRSVGISMGTDYLFGEGKPLFATMDAPVYASNYTWEKAAHTNIGLDLGMFRNRLNFSGDFYIRDTKDMLTDMKALPATYGAKLPKGNFADLRTKGYELTLAWRDNFKVANKPFSYSVSLLFSDYYTVITKYDNPDKSLAMAHYEGKRWGEMWGLRTNGYFLSDDEARNWHIDQSSVNGIINASAGAEKGLRAGDIKFVDLDDNNIISKGKNTVDDPGDYRIIGNSEPRYNYGVNLGAAWNGIDFALFIQGVGKRDWYPGVNNTTFWGPYARPYVTYIPKDFHLDIWSEDNPDAYYPRPRGYVALQGSDRELAVKNDKYLQNIGYCRLKNLTVGYTLPYSLTSKVMIEKLRVYFSGENLLTFTKLRSDYIDPEQATATSSQSKSYPYQKMFVFGIDINF